MELLPLICILARYLVVNPRNLPYYFCIWVPPSPLPVSTSFKYGPKEEEGGDEDEETEEVFADVECECEDGDEGTT